jgi:hypothetical protein
MVQDLRLPNHQAMARLSIAFTVGTEPIVYSVLFLFSGLILCVCYICFFESLFFPLRQNFFSYIKDT